MIFFERYKIQDTRYKIQDTRYKIQDTRYKIQDTLNLYFHDRSNERKSSQGNI